MEFFTIFWVMESSTWMAICGKLRGKQIPSLISLSYFYRKVASHLFKSQTLKTFMFNTFVEHSQKVMQILSNHAGDGSVNGAFSCNNCLRSWNFRTCSIDSLSIR